MKTALATVCVSGSLQEKLEAIASAGFSAVEIFKNDLIAYPGSPTDVRRICEDLGLSIITCQPFRDFEGTPALRRTRAFDRAERKFDLLNELGCDLLFVCSSTAPEALGGIDRLADDLAELADRAAKRNCKVGFEALAWGAHVNDYRDAWEIVRRANRTNLGAILDTFHIQSRGTDLSVIRSIPGDRIFFVQVADAPVLQADYLSWSRHWRCMPGQGDFNLSGFMDALVTTEYDGYLSLEIFNDRFRAGSARSVALDGHRSLIWLLDETQRRFSKSNIDTRLIAEAKLLAPAAPVQAVEFIEFALDANDCPDFEKLLKSLGFIKIGSHRSKDVTLWSQGNIQIVVNSEPDGFANSYQLTHGTSVCALAFKVPDALSTIERAKGLLDTPHIGAIGAGELNIPAVRGLGGSLIYCVDNASALGQWADVDFIKTGNPYSHDTKRTAGLLRVDHISQTMQYEEMLTWVLFYTSLFDAKKTPTQAVMDPGGVVQSQVIESGLTSGGDGLRLVLNGSQSHRTLSSRFVTDFFGSGVQHIAFATADIKTTVAQMMANGVEMLPIPANYYDDLEARVDLSPAEIIDLKSLTILHDRDLKGSFYQAYTATRDGGFFFEIVQREGYQGYGAANAGIRLTAQSRLARSNALCG